ncbi:uncharacterized protein LOC116201788 isoform X1 [Punica granatum]|uniref:Uncharacterized protein LOC116201788 isoform X1 n=1 Tax=Punica granatum TaxID=22663 RepID=A0A6P8DCQ0_PUNGR|nr:uncharacterized protein LOC116201788 isoform X1 [Punica granatum]
MGSGNSRIESPSRSSSPKVNRAKPRKFFSLICGCSSSHAPLEMEDYPDECSINPSELCGDPLFSEVQKPKEELYSISSTETGGLVTSANEAANSSITVEIEGRGNLQQVDAGEFDVINHGNRLFESGELVPPPRVSVPSPNDLDRDNSSTASTTSSDEPRSSEVVSVHISPGGIAVHGIDEIVINNVSEIYPEDEGVTSEVEIIENQGGESRPVVCSSGSSTRGASELPIQHISTGDETSSELIPVGSEFQVFSREQSIEPEGEVEVDVVSVSSGPLSSSAVDLSSWEARRNGRSFWDVFSVHSSRAHSDTDTPSIVFSTTDDSDYQGSRERWLFDHTDLFSDDGIRADSRFRGSRIQRSNERRRRRRFEFWDRLRSGLYEHSWQNSSCPLGLHSDGDECSCERYLTEESSARSSISRIVMLAEALFEVSQVLDEIHRQPMSFSLSMGPVTAPESVVDSFPIKSHEKGNLPESEDSVEQCNICFAEYEEGDKIRVLPCQHEYHMECVDKWLKEIHGVCPLCRGDVREGFAECSTSSSEVASS